MQTPEWLKRFLSPEGPREEDRLIARELHGALVALEHSPGWAHMKAWCLAEAQSVMTELVKPIDQRQRDYLASRIETINWLLELPRQKVLHYETLLSEPADNLPAAGRAQELDPLCPIDRED